MSAQASHHVQWLATRRERGVIEEIVRRALPSGPRGRRVNLSMDIEAVHSNGCELRLDDLLASDDFNFWHDIGGISRHLDRETGKLRGHFLPRFARSNGRSL